MPDMHDSLQTNELQYQIRAYRITVTNREQDNVVDGVIIIIIIIIIIINGDL